MQSETLAQEFARLVKEYHEGDDHTKPEAWNLLADYAVDNADAITAALSEKQAAEVAIKPLEWRLEDERDPDFPRWNAEWNGMVFSVFKAWWGKENKWGFVGGDCGFHHTEDEAKAAAQADYEQRIRSALVDVPAVIPTANCCICGRIVDTREKSEGGDDHGDETAPGKWTCSIACYDAFTGYVPDVPAVEPVAYPISVVGDVLVDRYGVPVPTTEAPHSEGEDSAEVIATLEFVALWAWREDPPAAARNLSDGERLSAIKYHPTIKALAATHSGSATNSSGGEHG